MSDPRPPLSPGERSYELHSTYSRVARVVEGPDRLSLQIYNSLNGHWYETNMIDMTAKAGDPKPQPIGPFQIPCELCHGRTGAGVVCPRCNGSLEELR